METQKLCNEKTIRRYNAKTQTMKREMKRPAHMKLRYEGKCNENTKKSDEKRSAMMDTQEKTYTETKRR